MFMLAQTWIVITLSVLFVAVCLFMILVILIQKPKGGGLSGAFGGAGGGANDAFGAKTGDVLTWFTVGCFVAFLMLAMGLTWTIRPAHESALRDLQPQPVDVTTTPADNAATTAETTLPEVPATEPSAAGASNSLPATPQPDVTTTP